MPLKPRKWLSILLVLLSLVASYALGDFFAARDMAHEKMNYDELLGKIASKDRELSVKDNELMARELEMAELEEQLAEGVNLLRAIERNIDDAKRELAGLQKGAKPALQVDEDAK